MLRQQAFQLKRLMVFTLLLAPIGLAVLAVAAHPQAFPQAGVDGIPASVDQLTVAFDGWGGDVIDPWQYIGTGMMQSYLNLRLLHRDEQMQVVPLWATEWRQTTEGIYLTLNPKAKWQDGTPATAEDLKANVEALLGRYAPDFKGTPRTGQFKRVVQEVQVIDPHHVFIRTEMPDPSFFWLISASSYHQVWFGPSAYLKQAGHEGYIKKPLGGGPYQLKTFKPGERIVWERWDDFWGDYPYWQKPQHRRMEWPQVPDDAARFALLRGKQLDMVVNIPYAIAKDLPRSESSRRGVNPHKGPIWTQTHLANGKMQITFDAEFIVKEKLAGREALKTIQRSIRKCARLSSSPSISGPLSRISITGLPR